MAFPGTYNISYYKGDTLEFLIYPKDTAGGQYSLNGYDTIKFTISNYRGTTNSANEPKITINALATNEGQYIKCVIRPIDGDGDGTPQNPGMVGGKTYVYDVEITKKTSPYYQVHTLLSGNVSVTEQVSLPSDEDVPVVVAPGAPTNLAVNTDTVTDTTATMTWTAPTTGTFDKYNIYRLVNPTLQSTIADAVFVESVSSTLSTYTYTGLTPATNYVLGLAAVNTIANPDVEGPKTAVQALITTDAAAPTAPASPTSVAVNQADVTHNSIKMTWTAPTTGTFDKYNIYYIKNPSGSPTFLDATFIAQINSGVTEYTYTALDADTNYIVGLTAVNTTPNPDLESNPALTTSVINTDIAPPNAPTNIVIDTDNITDTEIPISWTAPATGNAPVAYIVYYVENPTLPINFESAIPSAPIPAGTTSYTIADLTPATNYGVAVVAVGAEDGVSEPLVHMGTILTDSGV